MMGPQNLGNYAGGPLKTAAQYARDNPVDLASSVGALVGLVGMVYGIFTLVTPTGNESTIKSLNSQIKTQGRSIQKFDAETAAYWTLIGKNNYASPEEYCENTAVERNHSS